MISLAKDMKGISEEDRQSYEKYGLIILTTAVFAVIISAPVGAILINTLGVQWLTQDKDFKRGLVSL